MTSSLFNVQLTVHVSRSARPDRRDGFSASRSQSPNEPGLLL